MKEYFKLLRFPTIMLAITWSVHYIIQTNIMPLFGTQVALNQFDNTPESFIGKNLFHSIQNNLWVLPSLISIYIVYRVIIKIKRRNQHEKNV